MENGDLKRYYKVNNQDAKDFARLNTDGKIDKSLIPDDVGATVVANPTGSATQDLTKLQVGETIYGIDTGTEVIANPTLAGTEADLTGLQVGNTKYAVPQGTQVVANPTLAGTENSLNGLQVGDTKYKVDSGISQTDADARYLQLSGGNLTGSINIPDGYGLEGGGSLYLSTNHNAQAIALGTYQTGTLLISTTSAADIMHTKGFGNSYVVLDAANTSANPTLSGGEATLSSLKLNGTNYAVESGMTNPMTTQYDMIVAGANGEPARIGGGTNDATYKVLLRTNGNPAFSTLSPEKISTAQANAQYNVPYANGNTATSTFNLGKPASDFGLGYSTTAPTADNTDGIKIVVLPSEPATRYLGYWYIITSPTT